MIQVITSLAIVVISALVTSAQLLNYRSEIRDGGWKTPILNELKLTKESEIKQTNGSILLEKVYDAKARQPSNLLETKRAGKRIISILRCEFSWLSEYMMNGKTFAVDGYCGFVSYQYSRSHGSLLTMKSYLSGVTRYTFYDEDGDGKFERRYNSSPGDKNFEILIPAWVKN